VIDEQLSVIGRSRQVRTLTVDDVIELRNQVLRHEAADGFACLGGIQANLNPPDGCIRIRGECLLRTLTDVQVLRQIDTAFEEFCARLGRPDI